MRHKLVIAVTMLTLLLGCACAQAAYFCKEHQVWHDGSRSYYCRKHQVWHSHSGQYYCREHNTWHKGFGCCHR